MTADKRFFRQRLWVYILINTAIFVVAVYHAYDRQISGLELVIFRMLNDLPAWLYRVFLFITQAGSAWILLGVTLLLVGLRRSRLALRLFGVGITAYVATEVLKLMVARPRPSELLPDVFVRDHLVINYGFPSGHTAIAAAIGLVLAGVVPRKYKWLCWLGILLVAVSRVYLGVHAPLDVVGGFNIGVIVVCLSLLVGGKLAAVRKITRLK